MTVLAYVQSQKEQLEEDLKRVLSQQSISEGSRGVTECAVVLVKMLQDAGFDEAEIVLTDGLPGVWGYINSNKPHTLAVYAMFDHAPPTSTWRRQPFTPVTEPYSCYSKVVFGKGVTTKGPLVTLTWAIKAMREMGEELPFNVAYLLDGEEFVGSTHYQYFVHNYRDRLNGCIGVISPSAGQNARGEVSIGLGSKGCAYFELICQGKTWGKGPVTASVHSSAQGVVHSPVWRLVEALGTLIEPGSAGLNVSLPGFYDDIVLPQGEELGMLKDLVTKYKGQDWRRVVPGIAGRGEVKELADNLEGIELFTRVLYYPTFNINGIRAGYVNQDSPLFTLPGKAVARIDMRFAPRQKASVLMGNLRKHLDDQGFSDIQIKDLGTHDWAVAKLDDAIVKAAITAYEDYNCGTTLWPIRASGAPLGVFCSELGVPALGGVGIGLCGSDGVDEFMVLEGNERVAGIDRGAQFYADYFRRLGQLL